MAEVSEQPEDSQEEALPVLEEQPQQEIITNDPSTAPKTVSELSTLIDMLDGLQSSCARARESVDVHDQNRTQVALQEYSSALAYLPKSLQLLHDYRRFAPEFDRRVTLLHKGLVVVRGSADALSSEEQRVIAACASVRETVLAAIDGLEYALAHVRSSTQQLLSLIAFDGDGFFSFAEEPLQVINVALVQGVAYDQASRIRSLKRDIIELQSFEDHLASLQDRS